MICEKISLKSQFPFLGENGNDPVVSVYLPEPMYEMGWGEKKRPCLVICPGGGYGMVSQREAEPIALHFLQDGYNVFVLNYSVAPRRFPTQLREVAALMELIHSRAQQWHCDTEHVAIMGFSAGGHLAAHYSNSYDIPEVRAVFPDSKPVQASILCYPVISADPEIAHRGSFCNLLGMDSFCPETAAKYSCEKLVSDRTPPAFLWHTAADGGVPVANSLVYAQALAERKIPFALRVYPYGHHGLATVDLLTNHAIAPEVSQATAWLQDARVFLQNLF